MEQPKGFQHFDNIFEKNNDPATSKYSLPSSDVDIRFRYYSRKP